MHRPRSLLIILLWLGLVVLVSGAGKIPRAYISENISAETRLLSEMSLSDLSRDESPSSRLFPVKNTWSDLPPHLLVGYWHNWVGSPVTLRLSEIPAAYDVINVAFATPTVIHGSIMQFTPDPDIYGDAAEFAADIQHLRSLGKKILISIGGATGPVQLNNEEEIANFVTTMHTIITTYDFDGIDIDLEGQSLFLQPGDSDYRNPTSPLIVNFIAAINQLLEMFPAGFILTAAPETAYVQGGYQTYGGVWGAYLPVIHALRNRWTYIHVQHYNTGSMFGADGGIYQPATADFHVAMADMLLSGFSVDHWGANIWFEPLRPDQLLIGLPASPEAAGSGYTEPVVVHDALDYLIKGISFGGNYTIYDPSGYDNFRGLMTWSVNWDQDYNRLFSSSHRPYLDNLIPTALVVEEESPGYIPASLTNWPNPFNGITNIQYELANSAAVDLALFDATGRRITTLVSSYQDAGVHQVPFDGWYLAKAVYWYRLRVGETVVTRRIQLVQ